jgi:hypothetical protein
MHEARRYPVIHGRKRLYVASSAFVYLNLASKRVVFDS